jgi:hypothetical protein
MQDLNTILDQLDRRLAKARGDTELPVTADELRAVCAAARATADRWERGLVEAASTPSPITNQPAQQGPKKPPR